MLSAIQYRRLLQRTIPFARTLTTTTTNETALPQRLIPKLNQSVSRLGFGGYRASDLATHGAALSHALDNGINLIDTGANFENGRSEELVGQVLASSKTDRKNLTLITKAGYLTKQDVERLDSLGTNTDYVHVQGNSFHGISPRILADQLEQSLTRLQTSYVDIFMINAPERMLLASTRSGNGDLYKQLATSFEYLESLVRQGTIKGYGVCSNTMGSSHSAADHFSLASLLNACDTDHFCAVEAPFNLYEQHLGQDLAWLDRLDAHDIFWIANRPLNAITPQGQIRGLYNNNPTSDAPSDMEDLRHAFEHVAQLEIDMLSELPEDDNNASPFVWGQILSENLQRLGQHHFATQHYLRTQVLPTLTKDLEKFKESYPVQAYMEWADVYESAMHHLISCLVNYSYMDTLKKNNELDRILSALVSWPQSEAHSPLTVKALEIYLANKDIGAVVTGMRQSRYVDDAILALKESQAYPLAEHQLLDINRVLV